MDSCARVASVAVLASRTLLMSDREADKLFPKAYDALLNQLIAVLKTRLSRPEIEEYFVKSDVGWRPARPSHMERTWKSEFRAQ